MFAAEIRLTALAPLFRQGGGRVSRKTERRMNDTIHPRDAQTLICEALAQMTPSTAEEVAEASGLDLDAAAAQLEELTRRQRVMFNPLTKRFSLPKAGTLPGLAA